MDRAFASETRRDLDQGLIDKHRYWIEVAGVSLQSQALSFKGYGTSTGERVEHWRR